MCSANLMFPNLGWPKLWICTLAFGNEYFNSIAHTADRAAPKLCPVVTMLAVGCLVSRSCTLTVNTFSKKSQSTQNPVCMRQSLHLKYATFQKLPSQIQFTALLVPLKDTTTSLFLGLYATYPAALVMGCSMYNGYSIGIPFPVPHDHAYTQVLLQKAMAASLANYWEAVTLKEGRGRESTNAAETSSTKMAIMYVDQIQLFIYGRYQNITVFCCMKNQMSRACHSMKACRWR